jgi:endoglucanase
MKSFYEILLHLLKLAICLIFCIYNLKCSAQTDQRIKFTAVSSSINTGQDFSPWLNDNLDSLVQNVWQNNFLWVDLTLPLTQHSIITRFMFYDYEGVFTDAPDSIYALNGKTKTFLGTFTGPNYMIFDSLNLAVPVEADAIIIHKYSNSIPQKVEIFGRPDRLPLGTPPDSSKINPSDTLKLVKIPIDTTRWYQLNNASNGLGGLFDGDTTTTVNTGYGKLIANYDAYYPVAPGEKIDLYKIKLFSYEGGLGPYPLTISVIDSAGVRTNIGSFVGGVYNSWVGPYPGNPTFMLNQPVKNIKYIVLNCWYGFPTELQFYGKYTAGAAPTPVVKRAYPLSQYFGANTFEWNFEDPNNPLVVSSSLLNIVKSFTQVRHYMDWNKLESKQGEYTFNPVHSGGWNYDAMYKACKSNNIAVLGDLKTMPDWMIATYPAGQQDSENVPIPYGSDFTDPSSYILQAKAAFEYAARYGGNTQVSSALLSVDTSIRWTNDPSNQVKKGMGLIKYIECDNERDKWWKGRKAYQTSYEYAANLSAFYDGNKNTMGQGIGVKNADPNMLVVMGGLASADPTYIHGMIEWCRLHRGYKSDGTVNLCWDVMNYHLYSNNAPPQGYATTGVAPELSGTLKTAQAFLAMAHQYANDMPIWVTESGYDLNPRSPQRAPAIGNKQAAQVEADWILRTSLLYARAGIQRVFFYEMYDDNYANPTQYASSGLINANKTRRAAASYLLQANKVFGGYTYKQSLSANPVVDNYQLNDQQAYVLYVPDQVGRNVSYVLNTGTADSAFIYKPDTSGTTMSYTKVKLKNGSLNVSVTETPIFVIPFGTTAPAVAVLNKVALLPAINSVLDGTVKVFPNPSTKFVTVAFNNKNNSNVTIKLSDVNHGKVYQTYTSPKYGEDFSQTIDVTSVPIGVYFVQVLQGTQATMRKVIRTY